MGKSKITWTDQTWNPIIGCSKASAGCDRCCARRTAKWLRNMNSPRYQKPFKRVVLQHDLIDWPLSVKKPQKIFVCFMSDLFHEEVPFYFIAKVFDTMIKAHWHTFQVLTKRSERMAEFVNWYWSQKHCLKISGSVFQWNP